MNPITPAASVLLARGPGSAEVFLVGRSPPLRFLGGFYAFPGGKLHADDELLTDATQGLSPRHVAVIRELFEETGVLLAHQADGNWAHPTPDWPAFRQTLLDEKVSLASFLTEHQLHLRSNDLLYAGSLVTPPFTTMRFDTAFFVATCPPGQQPEIWPGELSTGHWASADVALKAWESGEILLSPPTVALLQVLQGRAVEALPDRLRPLLDELATDALHPIWFTPSVQMMPLFCNGIPPTTHTNAYLVGTGPVYLIDPGPKDPAEQGRLFAVIDQWQAKGLSVSAIILTHHHPDHIGAVAACAHRLKVPVLAHPLAARDLAGKVPVDRVLHHGDHLDLGEAPHGRGRWHLEAIHTPGHAPGHLAFYEPTYRLLFAGDMVSTISSIVITPPEGDLAVYLASLEKLKKYPARLLLPAHGSPSARPTFVLDEALAHRAKREEQLLTSLAEKPRTVNEIAQEMYRGLSSQLLSLAELQILAGLEKLLREGKVIQERNGWRVVG